MLIQPSTCGLQWLSDCKLKKHHHPSEYWALQRGEGCRAGVNVGQTGDKIQEGKCALFLETRGGCRKMLSRNCSGTARVVERIGETSIIYIPSAVSSQRVGIGQELGQDEANKI